MQNFPGKQPIKYAAVAAAVLVSAFVLLQSCGDWFDYDAKEFKTVTEAGKKFETMSDDEILAIVDRMTAEKLAPMATSEARAAFAAVIGALSPASLVSGGFTLTTDPKKDPCQGSDETPVENRMGCMAPRLKFYVQETKKVLGKVNESLGDMSKALLFIFGDKPGDIVCGKPGDPIEPPANFKPLLPKKWATVTLNYLLPAAPEGDGTCIDRLKQDKTAKPRYHLLVKRVPEGGTEAVPSAYLAMNPSDTDGLITDKTFPDGYTADKYSRYFFAINGDDGKITNKSDKTVGQVYLAHKDKDNFFTRVILNNLSCRADYPSIAQQAIVEIEVKDGVWQLSVAGHAPNFAATCSDAAGPEISANFYALGVANDTDFLSAHYIYPYAAATTADFTLSDANLGAKVCTTAPDLCSSEPATSGKLEPALKEAPLTDNLSYACFSKGSDDATWTAAAPSGDEKCGKLSLTSLAAKVGHYKAPFDLQTTIAVKGVPTEVPKKFAE